MQKAVCKYIRGKWSKVDSEKCSLEKERPKYFPL